MFVKDKNLIGPESIKQYILLFWSVYLPYLQCSSNCMTQSLRYLGKGVTRKDPGSQEVFSTSIMRDLKKKRYYAEGAETGGWLTRGFRTVKKTKEGWIGIQ